MKTVKFIFFITLAIILKACGTNDKSALTTDSNSTFSFFGVSEKAYQFKDPKSGLLVSSTKYPSNWEVQSKADYSNDPMIPNFRYQIKDENGMQAFNTPLKMYISIDNPQSEQMMRNAGQKNIKTLQSKEQLIRSTIEPKMQQRNFVFQESIALPELEDKSKKEASKYVTTPFNLSITGSVWANNNGQKAFVVLNYVTMTQPGSIGGVVTVWMYSTDILVSSDANFNSDVKNFIEANLAIEPTPEWENHMANLNRKRQAENRMRRKANIDRNQQLMQESAIAHQNRMAQQRASFNAHQQKMKGIWAAQDASHASFMNRNFGSGSSNSQQSFLNAIHGEETVYNPRDNRSYQIESGAKETWMDSDGNTIYSDDLFFNPNADNSLNNTEWSKVWEDY